MAKKKSVAKPPRIVEQPRDVPLLAGLGEHPRLVAVAAGTIGAGLVTRRGELVRGGVRMLAAQLVATAMRNAVAAQLDRSAAREAQKDGRPAPRPGTHHLTEAVVAGAAGWLAEAMVAAVFDRVEPAVERVIAQRVAA